MTARKQSSSKAAGGHARAEKLSAEERSAIARKAAKERWNSELPIAICGAPDHPLRIGDLAIPCYVLEDERRVLAQRGMFTALNMKPGTAGRGAGDRLTRFIGTKALKPFVPDELEAVISTPISFRTQSGGKAYGYEATVLADLCNAVLDCRKAGALHHQQEHIADQCEVLLRAFAKVGIVALVDEATGYQAIRQRAALQALLDRFLAEELAAWSKRFPDEFYRQIFRLRGWEWKGRGVNPPQVVAHYTKDLIYYRLAPEIIKELERRNPVEGGRRRAKHHQWLSDEIGIPALAQHIHAVVALARVCPDEGWDQFVLMMDQALPRLNDTMQLPLLQDFNESELPLRNAPN